MGGIRKRGSRRSKGRRRRRVIGVNPEGDAGVSEEEAEEEEKARDEAGGEGGRRRRRQRRILVLTKLKW